MKKFKKKEIISAVLLVVLLTAGYINWSFKGNGADNAVERKILGEAAYVSNTVEVAENDFYSAERIEREQARERAKELLNELINNPNTDSEAKTKAQDSIIMMAKAIDGESACEIMLKNKGFKDVMVSINEEGASVFVKADSLIPNQIAQIQETVAGETGFSADKIKISQVG